MYGHELVLCRQKLGKSLAGEGEEEPDGGGEGSSREGETKVFSVFPVHLFCLKLAFSDGNKC